MYICIYIYMYLYMSIYIYISIYLYLYTGLPFLLFYVVFLDGGVPKRLPRWKPLGNLEVESLQAHRSPFKVLCSY